MEQSGVLAKIKMKWTKIHTNDCLNGDSTSQEIDYKMVISAFILLGTGFTISLVISILESLKKRLMIKVSTRLSN